MRFERRAAVITAAGDGIGRATARLMAGEGANVVAVDVDGPAVRALAAEIEAGGGACLPLEADVLSPGDVDRVAAAAVERFGGIDVLVNCVGGSTVIERPGARVDELSLEEWERMMAFNLRGTFLCVHAVVPHMKARGRGAIVNLSSITARGGQAADRSSSAYVTTKAGIRSFTRKVARELGPFGIRCNAAAPGVTLTGRMEKLLSGRTAEEREAMAAAVPLRRLATPEDLAKVIAFLASDDAGFVTGQTIEVTGGQ
jgi:NAD(P)-dependent dehydrogenase (short-subunit alcohol dehydrogenase family)